MLKDLKNLDIPLEEMTKSLDDLKQSLDEAAKAEDIEVNSLMEVDEKEEDPDKGEIKCFDINTTTTDTDSEDMIEVLLKEDQKVKKPKSKYGSIVLLH